MKIDFDFENSWKLHGDFHILPQLTLERHYKSYSLVFGFLCWSGFVQLS